MWRGESAHPDRAPASAHYHFVFVLRVLFFSSPPRLLVGSYYIFSRRRIRSLHGPSGLRRSAALFDVQSRKVFKTHRLIDRIE
jgi:hypothetical protein